jgi:hypothetical protein
MDGCGDDPVVPSESAAGSDPVARRADGFDTCALGAVPIALADTAGAELGLAAPSMAEAGDGNASTARSAATTSR